MTHAAYRLLIANDDRNVRKILSITAAMKRSIELLGTEVAPIVRAAQARP
jgi:hypothetical protein